MLGNNHDTFQGTKFQTIKRNLHIHNVHLDIIKVLFIHQLMH